MHSKHQLFQIWLPLHRKLLVLKGMLKGPILKKKQQSNPRSLSSDLAELSQLNREQILDDKKFKIMQLSIEERKIEIIEQESTIKMEKLKAETEWECLNVE